MDIKLFLVILAAAGVIFLSIKRGKDIIPDLLLAVIISLVWVSFYPYDYTGSNDYFLFGFINLYPLVLWPTVLLILRELYKKITLSPLTKFFSLTIFYWISLGLLEAIGYYILGVRLATSFPSFLGLGILHLPLYGQLFYISVGPIYLLITQYWQNRPKLAR